METATPKQILPYTQKSIPKATRFNWRMFAFIAVFTSLFVVAVWAVVSSTLNQGIQHSGNVDLVDLKALGYFPFDNQAGTIQEVPQKWRDLDGKRIQLEGFMWSGQSAAGQLSDFQFVYNIQKCCFNGPPLVQERVFAHVPHGRSVPYYGDYCKITGVLHVDVKRQDGVIVSIYTLDVEKAELES